MSNVSKGLYFSGLVFGGAICAAAFAQTSAVPAATVPAGSEQKASVAIASTRPASDNSDDSATYATGKPLQAQSKEGFWGHMNPFARKKWVAREVDPIKDRMNELDQLQAKNANDIRDVDTRSQAGINKAMLAANAADAHAADASSKAGTAQTTADGASTRTDALNGTVNNLDQYQPVVATAVPFAAGRTTLGPQGKSSLDDMATKLTGEKGYIIEVQGYSNGGVQASQAMADTVVRYLVTEHQVPLYRIYRTGLGKAAKSPSADGETAIVNGVRVTLLHNSLAATSASVTVPTSVQTSADTSARAVNR